MLTIRADDSKFSSSNICSRLKNVKQFSTIKDVVLYRHKNVRAQLSLMKLQSCIHAV